MFYLKLESLSRIAYILENLDLISKLVNDKSKKEGKDQESVQLSTTPDPGYQ